MTDMTDHEVITKAVELADGWSIGRLPLCVETPDGRLFQLDASQVSRDALAAQLVRQVEALGEFVVARNGRVEVNQFLYNQRLSVATGSDRTMNTLRSIVESGVLEKAND